MQVGEISGVVARKQSEEGIRRRWEIDEKSREAGWEISGRKEDRDLGVGRAPGRPGLHYENGGGVPVSGSCLFPAPIRQRPD